MGRFTWRSPSGINGGGVRNLQERGKMFEIREHDSSVFQVQKQNIKIEGWIITFGKCLQHRSTTEKCSKNKWFNTIYRFSSSVASTVCVLTFFCSLGWTAWQVECRLRVLCSCSEWVPVIRRYHYRLHFKSWLQWNLGEDFGSLQRSWNVPQNVSKTWSLPQEFPVGAANLKAYSIYSNNHNEKDSRKQLKVSSLNNRQ